MAMPTSLQQSLARYGQDRILVVFDPDTANVEVYCEGGVDLSFLRGQEMVETDGVGIYDIITSGDGCTFEITVPERSMDVLDVLFPEGRDGTTYMGFGRAAGWSLRDNEAVQIRMRPWQTRTSGTEQVILHKCVPEGDLAFRQSKTERHAFTCTFRALPDLTKPDGQMIAEIYSADRA